jgi:hypothetical protein
MALLDGHALKARKQPPARLSTPAAMRLPPTSARKELLSRINYNEKKAFQMGLYKVLLGFFPSEG